MILAMVLSKLLTALIAVESGGNDSAIGDNGRAVGCLQITQPCLDDVNRIYHHRFNLSDCKRRDVSLKVAREYLLHYGGADAGYEKWARIWNGGPLGDKKKCTDKYWLKVRRVLFKRTIGK